MFREIVPYMVLKLTLNYIFQICKFKQWYESQITFMFNKLLLVYIFYEKIDRLKEPQLPKLKILEKTVNKI